MKFSFFTLLSCFLLLNSVSAQTTFSISTNPIWKIVNQYNDDEEAHTVIQSLANTTQTIEWVRTTVNITPTCYTQVCDLVTCYSSVVDSLTFDIAPNQSGNIIIHFRNPQAVEGANALIHLKLKNLNLPSDQVTLVYLFTSDLSNTKDLPLANVKLFPNPTTDFFQLENAEAVQTIRVYALDGREVARHTANATQFYSMAGLANGTYVVALEDEKGRLFQGLEVVKK